MGFRLLEFFLALVLIINLFIIGFSLIFRKNLYKKYYKIFLKLFGEFLLFIIAVILTFSILGLLK